MTTEQAIKKIEQELQDYHILRWLIENTVPNTPMESNEAQ